jgi:hypothetical protein
MPPAVQFDKKKPRKYRTFLIIQNYADDRKFLVTESGHSPQSKNQANGHRYLAVKLANYPCKVDTRDEVARPSTHHVQKHIVQSVQLKSGPLTKP